MARPKQLGEGEIVTLTIRLPRDLRDAFSAKLVAEDQQASQVLRRTIRQYLSGGVPATPVAPAPRPTPVSSPAPAPADEPMRAPEQPSEPTSEVATSARLGSELMDMIWAVNAEAQAELEAQAQRPANAEKHD